MTNSILYYTVYLFIVLFTPAEHNTPNKNIELLDTLSINKYNVWMLLHKFNVAHPHIVYKQIMHETGHLTSPLAKNHNNLIGMKYPKKRKTLAHKNYNGYASYKTILHCIYDIKLWQFYNKLQYTTEKEYMQYLSKFYAEDKMYIQKIKNIKIIYTYTE